MDRQPVVAGRFYDADPARLNSMLDGFLGLAEEKKEERTLLAMVPHAGYVYSGAVCGKTLAMSNLASTILLLGPNHTGRGDRFALWAGGSWGIPGGQVPVDEELAKVLLDADPMITADTDAHVGEHSLEVILPFLHRLNLDVSVVPIAMSAHVFDDVATVGKAIGQALKEFDRPVSIVVSSDMSHYISDDEARKMDGLALAAASSLDPNILFSTVREHNISMCGVLPMTTGLFAALELGATKADLVAYATSGEVSGDFEQVVGYAGVIVS
ncbi:AmmeMemoRadiSam system protein B [Pseudodesulfovibrio sp. zrk46]|uniref:AmmeMemoRadiSam system protein B n=1 Tax=Pseudodesulfovibrio sp. zrk46 TaxID=2725288 RepID=UPI001449160D|nr:AmmeMemoRadiSam system protein B [Pseudodesulfovibrio sp. zrk46]QJB57347.1 AmmeMemoRadiSam system protein B [Pseudodesulfovibrio sp. zrk46]